MDVKENTDVFNKRLIEIPEYHFCLKCKLPIDAPDDSCNCEYPDATKLTYPSRQRIRAPSFKEYKNRIFGISEIETDYWIKKHLIPLGTFHHPWAYLDKNSPYYCGSWDNIPDDEICCIPFQPTDIDMTSRRALNIMQLGKTGDMKSQLFKQIWYVLQKAGYWCIYIDAKSFDAGRVSRKWSEPNNRLCPRMDFDNIKVQKYVPIWAKGTCENRVNNKKNRYGFYDIRLSSMTEVEQWEALDIGSGAGKLVEIIKNYNKNHRKITMDILIAEVSRLGMLDINTNAKYNMLGKLDRIKALGIIGNNKIDFYKEWRKGNSLTIHYNLADRINMAFDIGMQIKALSKINERLPPKEKRPIMVFEDDGSIYLKKLGNGRNNLAMKETEYIGNNYRSLGLNTLMAVQSLAVVDETVAEIYKWKIISPLFAKWQQLTEIGIPYRAIELLRTNFLEKDPDNYIIENILVNDKNDVVHFFPFTPPCNHFKEVDYFDTTIEDDDYD